MPISVGGSVALVRSGYRCRADPVPDPELVEFQKREKYIQRNLACNIEFSKAVIPATEGRMEGLLVLEAFKDIEHIGIFILMKGLPISEKKIMSQQQQHYGTKQLTEVRFTVLKSTFTAGARDSMKIDGGSKETYPLELDIPEELPIPLLTSTGRLMYRVHAYIATGWKRNVVVGETSLRWLGYKLLKRAEIRKELKIEQQVQSKRALMGLGWRKSALVEWRVSKAGYLPGERINVELWGECKEKEGLQIECKVELVQKVWYQVPSGTQIGKMWTKMKTNVLVTGGKTQENGGAIEIKNKEEGGDDDGEEKKMSWRGKLQVPLGITPTVRFDFMNSVSYTIRASVGVAGESKEDWVSGEMPLLIGNFKEVADDDDESDGSSDDVDEEEDQDFDSASSASPSPRSPASPCNNNGEKDMHRTRSGSIGTPTDTRRSHSQSLIPSWARLKRGSASSMESLGSSTLSLFRLPPSYSQLSSRRPTLESLPPAYYELELPVTPLIVVHQQTEEDTAEDSNPGPPDSVDGITTENPKDD